MSSEAEIARKLWNKTENKAVKEVLSQFSEECPACGAGREDWNMLVPVEKSDNAYKLFSYECSKCGKQFKKVEEGEREL